MRSLLLVICLPFFLSAQVNEMDLNANWKFRKVGDKEWLNATVPGTVHTDLLCNKKIPDPFSAGAEQKLQWIEKCDWEYESVFTCDHTTLAKQNVELFFEGLDTYAKVYLNDSLILQADNMFRSWTVPVKKIVRKQNKLKIVFISAVNEGRAAAKKLPYTLPEGERVFTRKAQYQFGWDFAPRYVTCGIWKGVLLRSWDKARFENIYVHDQIVKDFLKGWIFAFEIDCKVAGDYRIKITPELKALNTTKSYVDTFLIAGKHDLRYDYFILDAELWNPVECGSQKMYDFKIQLIYKGHEVDKKNLTTGLRKVEVAGARGGLPEQEFYFFINDHPVFMKGANFIPPDVFLPRVKKENYKTIIQNALSANMNMLRVWGGGTYADEEFYDLCDANGIMVWQDMMFACAMYPGDEKFLQNVTEEVKESVKRLSRHPCVVLWCGNNEIDEGWINWGWQKQFAYSKEDSLKIRNDCKKLFEDIIPAIIKECDAEKTYWPSSPKFGWGRKESMLEGDSHYWGVWWGLEPFEVYNKKVGRFMSEYGFQGMPSIETLQRNCGEILDSACLKYYEKHPKGFQTINEYMKRDFRMPKTAIDYVYVSQLLQSRGLQIAIEAHRRNKPYCMGSLYWQFNDCWPGISWSAIDFNDNWKAAHYTVRNCFSNVILSVVEENDSLKVYVISDRATAAEGELNYQLMDLSGKTIWKNMKPVSIEANSSRIFFSLPLAELKAYNKNSIVFTCTLRGIGGNQLPAAYHYFASPKDLDLAKPKISMRWLSDDRIELSTDVLAKNLFLFCEDSVQFEDNFFDLLPGEMKIVNLKGATKKQSVIKIKSLADTY